MDIFKKFFKNKDKNTIHKFYFTLAIGVLLLLMSSTFFSGDNGKDDGVGKLESSIESDTNTDDYVAGLEKRLKNVLSQSEGVGEVSVMITAKGSRELVVAEDKTTDKSEALEDKDGETIKQNSNNKLEGKVVMLENNKPLILKEVKPEIEGVIIVAQGGGNILVKSEIIGATQAILGIESHKIEVLKMK